MLMSDPPSCWFPEEPLPLRWNVTPGERRTRSSMLRRPCWSSFSWLKAVRLIGTSCRRSSRRVAVTTTSCTPAPAAASVVSDVVVCASAESSGLRKARTDTAPRIPRLTRGLINLSRAHDCFVVHRLSVSPLEFRSLVYDMPTDDGEQHLHTR